MRIDGPQITGSFNLNGDTVADLDIFTTTSSFNMMTASMATTGSNVFVGTQTSSGSIVPSVNNTYDLGSPTHQFRHVYISSGSLYVNGTKVLGSTAQELQITTDAGQSFKILESSSDTITLQSADGNITLATSGGGDVIMDPTNGVIGLKGTVTIYTGNKITSSDGNSIQFGNGIAVTGSIVSTTTSLVSGSSQISYSGLSGVPSDIISGSGQLTTLGIATTGSNTFNGNLTVTGFIDTQELRTTYISSSILYRSGSTKFGDELTDTHSFTGSILISGSISVPGSNLVSGSSQVLNGSGVFSGSAQLPSGIVSSSAQTIANLPSGVVSGSAQTIANLPSGTVSGSSQILNGTGFVKTSGASITYDNSTYLTTGTASSTYLPLAGGTVSGDIQMGSNQNFSIKFRTATAWDYSLKGINDDFFIRDNPGLNYLALYYNTGGNNRYTSLMGVFNVYASGAATLSSGLTVNGIYYVPNTSYFVSGTSGFRFNNSADTFNNFIVRDNGDTYTRGNASVGTATADNTYQGITIYGTNPSLRLKGSSGSSWTWVEFATSGGTNNFSMGVNQTTPAFVIKAGAGLDSPNFTLSSAGAATFSSGVEAASFYTNDTRYISNQIQSGYNANSEDSDIWINYTGYQGGATRFRDFRIGNGKQGQIALFDGSTGVATFSGGFTVNGVITATTATFNVNDSSSIILTSAGTNASMVKAASGDELYLGGNDTWQMRLSGGNILMDNGGNVGIAISSPQQKLSVGGSIRANRSIYNWFQAGTNDWDGYAYLHLKTNMWAGGSPNGNIDYTMSLFSCKFYSYSSAYIREGNIGFHNWSGSHTQVVTTGNAWTTVYTSSDGYTVLVIALGSGSYMGVTVDWHQAFGYPFQDKSVTTYARSQSASGVY